MDSAVTTPQRPCQHDDTCLDVPEFRRLRYFYGQMLGAPDFQTEQAFFREKIKLHNRCLHGYGVVCGLLVRPVPIPKDCTAAEEAEERQLLQELEQLLAQRAAAPTTVAAAPAAASAPHPPGPGPAAASAPQSAGPSAPPPAAPGPAPASDLDARIESLRRQLGEFYRQHCRDEPRTKVRIECGLALDCEGNELALRSSKLVDLVQCLSAADHQKVKQGADRLYLSLCYCEQPVDPVRPVLSDACGGTPECVYGKLQDSIRVQVTLDRPAEDKRCDTCCEPCTEKCLLLAEIVGFCPGHPLREQQILNHVRRPLGHYTPTTITGISWHTGHHYTPDQAQELMGTGDRDEPRGKGLEIRFSRRVLASTIRPGVIDTWVIEGGRTRRGIVYRKDGEFVDKPDEGTVDRIFYRDTTDEELEAGDRVVVVLLTDFILDECCRPVDGENVGGRVPTIDEYAERHGPHPDRDRRGDRRHRRHEDDHPHDRNHDPEHGECEVPPRGYLPWTSGNGMPGGTFVSWFYIREEERERR